MDKNQFQQGDVLIRKIEKLPENSKEIKHDGILAWGEVTGHKHRLDEIENVKFFEKDGQFFFQVLQGQKALVHEEHRTHTFEPGIYSWGQVREKDWISGMVRTVVD